ncbi:MAG: ABC transporter permease [Deltaproteobacteria bacterium]|nr:ABC transporter permease [Deltaproteobacteria bacterium]
MFRNIVEMWRFRSLTWALVVRHLNTRYRGSFLGFIWSFLNPLCLIAVYSLVFRYYVRFGNVEHYTLFLFAGLLPWIWFSSGLLEATASISGGGSLITKAMFPAHILPLVSVLTNCFNFLFALPILIGYMLFCGESLTVALFYFPLIIFIELIFIVGLALALAAINVHYRDVQHILGNVLTFLFFLSPILYPVENVPAELKITLLVNPLAYFTQMYQAIFTQGVNPSGLYLGVSACCAGLSFVIGNMIFNHYREDFAELV